MVALYLFHPLTLILAMCWEGVEIRARVQPRMAYLHGKEVFCDDIGGVQICFFRLVSQTNSRSKAAHFNIVDEYCKFALERTVLIYIFWFCEFICFATLVKLSNSYALLIFRMGIRVILSRKTGRKIERVNINKALRTTPGTE